jgi:hypothetical protein
MPPKRPDPLKRPSRPPDATAIVEETRSDLDVALASLTARERKVFRASISGVPLLDAIALARFSLDPAESLTRLVGLPRWRAAIQRVAPLLTDRQVAANLLAPILRQAAIGVATDPRASAATRLAALREAEQIGRAPGSGPAGNGAAMSTGLPTVSAGPGGGGNGPGRATAEDWAARMREAKERRARAILKERGPMAVELGDEARIAESARPGDEVAPGVEVPRAGEE